MRLDSIRRVRLALEMGDSSVLVNAPPPAPDKPKIDTLPVKEKKSPVNKKPVVSPEQDPSGPPENKTDTIKTAAILRRDENTES
jgi:hypothetical protein